MTNIKSGDGDNNPKTPGEGDDFIAGAGGGNKPAEQSPADPQAGKTEENTIAGANSADKNKRNLKSNLGKIFGFAVKGLIFGPPLLYGIIAAGDVIGGKGVGPAASDFWTGTTNVWRTVVDVPVGAARGVAGVLENNVVVTGPRADVVVYCAPKLRNTSMASEQATRVFAELNQINGYARGMMHGSINDVTRAIDGGGYPILVGAFSDPANGRPMPTVTMEISPTPAGQTCPQGEWATPQAWRITRQ